MTHWHGIIISTMLFLTGCGHIGPKTVTRDRFDYNTAIANSWKEQTLLNIVKLRYADFPLFMEVASVVSGYTVESSVNLGGTVSSENTVQGDFFSLGTAGKYTDRPTITYAPITGRKFSESFMTPIPPRAILFLLQTGWPAEIIFPITVDSMNGLRSQNSGGITQRQGNPDFYRAIALLGKIQQSGAVGMRILKEKDAKESTVMFFHREGISSEIDQALKEVRRLLGLPSDALEMQVTFGLLPKEDRELAMLTRSMMQIMIEISKQIDVPITHADEGRTNPSIARNAADGQDEIAQLINVKNSLEKPEDAFTAVKYRDHWFWLDDRDIKSKRIFAVVMLLFSFTETGGTQALPLVTIPAG